MKINITKNNAWRCGMNVDGHTVTMAITFPVMRDSRPEYSYYPGQKESKDMIRIVDLKDFTATDYELLPELKKGNVYDITIDFEDKDPEDFGYQLIRRDRIVDDIEAIAVRRHGHDTVNLFSIPKHNKLQKGKGSTAKEELFTPASLRDMSVYKLHVRGFTRHPSSKVNAPGTFEGVLEKLHYIKYLGMNTIELMPIYDFNTTEKIKSERIPRNNFWGYGPARFMAVKPEYADQPKYAEVSFIHFVRELHHNGFTVIMEIIFTGEETMDYQLRCLRHWRHTYKVDGFHVSAANSNMKEILDDPYLSDAIIFAENFDGSYDKSSSNRRAILHDGFLESSRAYLRGDRNATRIFKDNFLMTWQDQGKVNYMAGHNGMTLMDVMTYRDKHNEANGEENKDGTNRNISCNYGHEGPDCSRGIALIRERQLKNALVMTLLSEGIPMLMAGDECGRTQRGNNNAWCQDNTISWFDWKKIEQNKKILTFVHDLMRLRKESTALHAEDIPVYTDKLKSGFPDVSVHGIEPWLTDNLDVLGVVGFMYAKNEEIVYVAFNMGVLDIELSLPTVRGRRWHVFMSTENDLPKLSDEGRSISMQTRSVSLLKAL